MATTAACLIAQSILINTVTIGVDQVQHILIYCTIWSNKDLMSFDMYSRHLLGANLWDCWDSVGVQANDLFCATDLTKSSGENFTNLYLHFSI